MKPLLALVLVTAALAAVPAPAESAAPRCGGVPATIVGTGGPDRIVGTRGRDVVVARGGDDTVLARGGNDLVCGGEGRDRLEGGPGRDRLLGELDRLVHPGDETACLRGDELDGGAGADRLDPGRDARGSHTGCGTLEQVRFRHGAGGVRVDLLRGTARGQGRDTIVVDQALEVVGSDRDDDIVGTTHDEVFDPRRGDDRVLAGDGRDRIVEGSAANGDDTYDLGDGRDFAVTRRGHDTVLLGTDDDQVIALNPARMSIEGGNGADSVSRYAAPDQDRLSGGDGPDELMVVLEDGPGDPADLDIPAGLLTVDDATVVVAGFESWIFSAERSLTVLGSDQPESVTAWSRHEPAYSLTASMGAGDDHVQSDEGDDHVDGGEGADYADLGEGDDVCQDVEDGPC